MKERQKATCPTCSKRFEWKSDSPWRPFCSERCRLIDLGDWFEEKNRITDKNQGSPFLPPDEGDY